VGLIISELSDPFYGELAAGADRELTAAGILAFLGTTGESPARQAAMMKVMREHGAAGFIICPALGADRALLAGSEDWHLPMVSVMRPVPGARASFVGTHNRYGAERATVHLLGLGHRHIAFLGGKKCMAVQQERLEGYTTALRAVGLPIDPSLIVECAPNGEGGYAALRQILALTIRPTAVLCFNDAVAFGVMRGLARRGLRAGHDLAVIGFGNVHEAQLTTPALTTVSLNP